MTKPQRRHYQSYYIQQGDTHIPCTHEECFAPGEPPTPENPYKQRWYYDFEGSIAVRMEHGEKEQTLCRWNASSMKRIERQDEKDKEMLEADRTGVSENGLPFGFEIPCSTDVAKIVERMEFLRILYAALATLSKEYQELWEMVEAGAKRKDIAQHFGITTDGAYYKEKRMYELLYKNEALKNWFEKS